MDNRLERYAEWLVANQNKKGSPEWDTVSNAYKQLRQGAAPVEQPKQDLDSSILDVPVALGRGAVQGVRFIADAFGADNPVSNALRGTENYLADLMSAQAKADSEEIGRIMKEAEDKGVGDQVIAAIKALSVAPVDLLSQALGTAAPTIVGGLAGLAFKGGATAATAIGSSIGASMGAGVVKSTIYDAVEDALLEAGEKPEIAKAKAEEAQEYTGENWGSILAGTALGGVAGVTGIEKNIVGRFAAKQAAKDTAEQAVAKEAAEQSVFGAATKEALPEAAQAGQEQLAANLALQGEIDPRTNLPFNVPTFRGVAGQAALEGLLGGGLGAGVEVSGRLVAEPKPAEPSGEERREIEKRELSPEEQLEAQLARQRAGQGVIEQIKQDVGTDLEQVDADTQAAIDAYEAKRPKPTAKKIPVDEQARDLKALNEGKISLEEFKAKYEGAALGPETTGVGAAGDQEPTGTEVPPTGVTGVGPGGVESGGEPAGQLGAGEEAASSAIDPENLSDEAIAAELGNITPEELAELEAEANADFRQGKRQGTLNIGEDTDRKERLKKLLAVAKARGIEIPSTAAVEPAAPVTPKRQVQLDDQGRVVFGTEEERSARKAEADEFMVRVQQQYNRVYKKRLMVSEADLGTEDPELEKAETAYKEALKSDDPEQIADAAKVLDELSKKETQGKRKALPEWRQLTPDEKQVYLDGLSDPYDPINNALTNLINYRNLKGETTQPKSKEWNRQDAIAGYEINRDAESRGRGVEFPSWMNLSKPQRDAYLKAVEERSKTEPSALAMRQGFAALRDSLITEKGVRATGKMSDEALAEEQKLKEAESAAQGRARAEMEEEKLSLGQKLPEDVVQLVKDGDTKGVLEYLRKNAVGISKQGIAGILFDKASSRLNRVIAGSLAAIDLKTKIEYVDSDDFIAEYDVATDTIRVGNRGLNETAVLHELVHAGTVKVISDVLSGKEKDPVKVEAVKRLEALMKYSKKTLGGKSEIKDGKRVVVSEGYNRAYQNIYEFIAYAMSDPKFQAELQKITVPKNLIKYSDVEMEPITRAAEARDAPYSVLPDKPDSLYTAFVQTVADIIGVFSRVGTLIKTLGVPKEFFDRTRRKSTKEVEEDLELTDEEKQRIVEDIEKREADPEYKKLKNKLSRVEKIEFGYIQRKQKLVDSLISEATKGLKKEQAEKVNEFSPQIQNNPEYKKAVADIKRQQKNVEAARKEIEDAGFGDLIPGETIGDQKYGVMVSTQPGALGNLFLELAGIFDTIIAAPPEGGILLFSNSPQSVLPMGAKRAGAKPRPIPKTTPEQRYAETKERLVKKGEEAETGAFKKFATLGKSIFTKEGYTNLVRAVQNRLVDFQNKERELDRLGKLVMVGTQDEFNDLNTKYASAMGIAQNKSNEFKELTDEAIDAVRIIMKKTGKSYVETLADLQMHMTGLHGLERRMELFYRNVPLNGAAGTRRQRIYEELASDALTQLRTANAKAADAVVKKLKRELVTLTTDPNNFATGVDPEKTTPAGYMYNALGYDFDVEAKFKDVYKNASPEVKAELEKLFGTDSKPGLLKQVIDKSAELNREANYFTDAVENTIKFYGYKHYFPFKGKGDTETAARLDAVDPFVSDRLGGDFKQGETTFMGRQTDADNPFLQVFTEATKSSMRAGFKDVPHAMKNLINQKEVAGKLKKNGKITFAQRSAPGFRWSEVAGQNDFFVYNPDGSVDIYEINDPKMRMAFKGLYKTENAFFDTLNKVTSTVGSFHTRYNPAFAPLDFVRNLMTYAGIVGFRYGPKTAGQLYAAMGKVVAEGGMHKTFVFTKAFGEGNIKKLDKLKKKGDYYKDVARYYELGGQVAYMDSLTNSQALENLGKELQRNPKFSPKKWATYFDSWMAMFETTSRIATFRTLRDKFKTENPNMSLEEAEQRAMSQAKDLANFQQVGNMGRELGALFMFWRPAATGAVKAIDALLPAFNNKSRAELVALYKTKPNTTDAQAERAADVFLTEVKNARIMGTVMAGAGFFAYTMAHMMAGEDDEGRNKVATDDMARWVRFARFNLGVEVTGRDLVFQVPWGFGPGAIASAGAQMAGVVYGGHDLMRAGLNIASAGFESFVPLPVSKIDPVANPALFLVDSVTPSVLRPLIQFSANTDGLGRKIYTDRQSRYADAYLGGDNVPEMYKDAVRYMFEATNGALDMSPGTAYFFANNYIDGASRVLATTYNVADVARGQKEFDIRTDTFLLDSYFKAPANFDAIQFSKLESKIKDLDARMKALQNTPQFGVFLNNYPMAPGMVDFYNRTVNGTLRKLRARANEIRRSDMTQKEKNEQLQLLNKQQNQIKRAFVTAVEGLETGYTGYEE